MARGEHFLISDFREVYPFAVRTIRRCIEEVLAKSGLTPADVDALIPHHASANIVEDGIGEAGLRAEQVVMSIDHTGNTSSASVPIALDEHVRRGGLADGQNLLMLALGGGMGWGSALVRWAGAETIARGRKDAR
jgi:3-oxoacyl-[acyl-carrier-protein] synthase-3